MNEVGSGFKESSIGKDFAWLRKDLCHYVMSYQDREAVATLALDMVVEFRATMPAPLAHSTIDDLSANTLLASHKIPSISSKLLPVRIPSSPCGWTY